MFNVLKGLQKGQINEAAGIFAQTQTYAYLGMQISNFISAKSIELHISELSNLCPKFQKL